MPERQSFIIRSKQVRGNAVVAVQEIQAEPVMVVTIKPYRKSKTQEQLGYLWTAVIPTIRRHIEDSVGESYSDQNIYDWFVDEMAEHEVVSINGKPKITKVSASKMNVRQMSEFIDKIIMYSAENLQCVIPPPTYV